MNVITINTENFQQVIDGWGTSLCWWANAVGGFTMKTECGDEKREELMQMFFSEEGLNLNIARYNIGAGDNPDEKQHMFHFRGLPCFKSSEQATFDKEADKRQIWVLERALEIREGDMLIEAFVNSPPWWLTKSLCSAGNVKAEEENLSPDKYTEFIEYCAEVLSYLQDNLNIKVDYFVPMNEPASAYWAKGQRQEGNKVNAGDSQSILLSMADEKLKTIQANIEITGTDETNPMLAVESYHKLSEDVKERILKKINYHHYTTDTNALKELKEITYPDGFEKPRYKLWMDEVCYGDGEDNFDLAKNIIYAINRDINIAHVNAWVIWQAMDTLSENIATNCHWGLLEGMYQDKDNNELEGILDVSDMGFAFGDFITTNQYYVMGHYSKYIQKGYIVLANDDVEFSCVSAISPDKNTLVVVLYNDELNMQNITLNLAGFVPKKAVKVLSNMQKKWEVSELSSNQTNVELEAKTIVTLKYTR